jgi:hypothetical protein
VLAGAIQSGLMPPFYAEETEECPNPWGWKHDPRLSAEEEALLNAWASGGAPVGDPDSAAEIPPPPFRGLQDSDVTLVPAMEWTTSIAGNTEDEFVCFSLDPQLDTQKWLEAFQVIPGDSAVVHHVLVGVDQSGESAALAGEGGLYDCFGGFEVDASFIGAWVPGARATEFPEHSAFRVSAGSRLVLQVHYHLLEEAHVDGTSLALRWAEGTPVRVEFRIPAGESAHVETLRFDLWDDFDRSFQTFLVGNHMHYVGKSMRMWVERGSQSPESGETCLLHTPRWDFDWQQFFFYDNSGAGGPLVYPGDSLWLECEYDNTLANPQLESALVESGQSQPVDVVLGNGTLDEMCIGVMGQVFDVSLEVQGSTHAGGLEVQVQSSDLGFDMTCTGPSDFRIGEDGAIEGVAACGLDVLALLATIEFSVSGSVSETGQATGVLGIKVIGVSETTSAPWTGTMDGDTLTISVSAEDIFAGGVVGFEGVITATGGS